MKFEDLPSGARIFVDANILIYHFSGMSLECQAFFQRCESRQVEAFTGVHIVLEVTHRLMMLEALQNGLITGGQPARKLKEQPEIIKGLHEYNQSVRQIPRLKIRVRAITSSKAAEKGARWVLPLVNQSYELYSMTTWRKNLLETR